MEMEMESSSTATEQLGKLSNLEFPTRVTDVLSGTGLDFIHKVAKTMKVNCYHDNGLLSVLVDKYDPEDECFKVDGKALFVGLEDVLRITGLKIQGKAITPVEKYKAITRCITSQGLRWEVQGIGIVENTKYVKGQSVRLKWLESFIDSFGVENNVKFESYVKACVLYILGTTILATTEHKWVSTKPLFAMKTIEDIKETAFGVHMLSHLHLTLKKLKRKDRKGQSIPSHLLFLQIWALESFGSIRKEFFGPDHVPELPGCFPLSLGWAPLMAKALENRNRSKYYRRHLASLNSLEYNETPYSRLNPDPLPDALKEQLEMKRYCGVLIHPIKRDFIHHRPELCLSRLGLVNLDLSQPLLKRENSQKARTYAKHRRQWNNFKEYLLEETGSGTRDDREQSEETRSGVGGNHIDYNSDGSDARTRDDREPTEVQGDASGPKARKGIKRIFELDPNTPLCRSNRIKFISSSSPRGPPVHIELSDTEHDHGKDSKQGRIDSSNETSGVESTSDGDESMLSGNEINRDDESMSNDDEDNDGKSLSNGDQVNMRSDESDKQEQDQPLEVTETAVDGLNEEDNDTGMMETTSNGFNEQETTHALTSVSPAELNVPEQALDNITTTMITPSSENVSADDQLTTTKAQCHNSSWPARGHTSEWVARMDDFATRFNSNVESPLSMDDIAPQLSRDTVEFQGMRVSSELVSPLTKFSEKYCEGNLLGLVNREYTLKKKNKLIEEFGMMLLSMEACQVKNEETFLVWRDACRDFMEAGLNVGFLLDFLMQAARQYFGYMMRPEGSDDCCARVRTLQETILQKKKELVCLEEELGKAQSDLGFIPPDVPAFVVECALESSWKDDSRAAHYLY